MSEPAAQLSSHLASLRYKLQHHGEWASNTTLVQLVAEEVLVVRRAVSKQRDDLFNAIYTVRAATSVCFLLVLLTGLGMFELGSVRNKNVRQILNKHFLQAMFAVLCFYTVGYKVAFANMGEYSVPGFHGATGSVSKQNHMLFHMLYTILVTSVSSMPLAERGLLKASIGLTCLLATVTVPLAMSLVWHPKGLLSVHRDHPMFGTGFVDYAGGGVLHVVSGAASLVAAVSAGPRLDEKGHPRFSALANPTDFDGASPIFTCLGYVWVWASWFGFLHGGSLLPGQVLSATSCAVAAANVTLAQSFGIMSYGVEYFFHRHRRFNFGRCFNRGLAALVASNAFSGLIDPKFAPLAGLAAGALYVQVSNLMIFLQIDDPVDCAAVHLTGGVTGLLAVALFADGGQLLSLYGTDVSGVLVDGGVSSWWLLAAQLVGIGVMLVLAVVTTGTYFAVLLGLPEYGLVADSLVRANRLNELQGLDMGLSGGHFFPPELWKLIEQFEALNRGSLPGVHLSSQGGVLDLPDPVRHMAFGSVHNAAPVKMDSRRSSIDIHTSTVTDVVAQTFRAHSFNRGGSTQSKLRTPKGLRISSHGNVEHAAHHADSSSGDSHLSDVVAYQFARSHPRSASGSFSGMRSFSGGGGFSGLSRAGDGEYSVGSVGRSESSSGAGGNAAVTGSTLTLTGSPVRLRGSPAVRRRARGRLPFRVVEDGVHVRARPSFKHQADRAARLPKRLQRCHSAPAVLAVQGGEEILVSLTAGPPENRQPLHHAVTAQDGRSIVLSLTEREKPRISQVTNEPPAAPAAAATADTATVPPASLWSSLCESCVPRTPPVFHARASNNKPDARFAWGNQVCRDEDFFNIVSNRRLLLSQARLPDGTWTVKEPDGFFNFFAVMDGHNGPECGLDANDFLLEDIMDSMLPCLNEAQWEAALPRAISAGYQLRNRQFVSAGRVGGCTATTVFLNGWSVTCGNVGDSSCYVDSGNEVQRLSADHRLDFNDKEVRRLKAAGQELHQRWRPMLNKHVGPMRAWPGGLALSRSIGDADVGPEILPIPEVFRMRLNPQTGGRIVLASDGLWDGFADPGKCDPAEIHARIEKAITAVRGMDHKAAVAALLDMSLVERGIRDDVTVIVVDVLPRAVDPTGSGLSFAAQLVVDTAAAIARTESCVPRSMPSNSRALRKTHEQLLGFPVAAFGLASLAEIAPIHVLSCSLAEEEGQLQRPQRRRSMPAREASRLRDARVSMGSLTLARMPSSSLAVDTAQVEARLRAHPLEPAEAGVADRTRRSRPSETEA